MTSLGAGSRRAPQSIATAAASLPPVGYGGAVPRPIHSVRVVTAPPEVVHDLLVDPRTWSAWAPEHSWDEPPPGRLVEGWSGRLSARAGPSVLVRVTWSEAPTGG